MKVQSFKGRTAQEALDQARQALGPEALILQTRRVQSPGARRWITPPQVEVLAAVDSPASGPLMPPARTPAPPDLQGELAALRSELAGLRRLVNPHTRPSTVAAPSSGSTGSARLAVLPDDAELVDAFSAVSAERPSGWPIARPAHPASRSPALEALARRLLSQLVTCPIEMKPGDCTTVALIGPTGVGKTTTIAKLAAVASRVEQKRVAFIAADTFRIGAVEQLQTYAQLLEVPMRVAYCLEDVEAAREEYAGCDLVLIDTVGRPPAGGPPMDELYALLEAARPDEVHLELDARGSYATHRAVLEGFHALRPTHLLLSKLDETPRLEDALAAALEGGLPLSYVTTGQRVPEDLAAADGAQLAAWLLGGG